MWLIINGRKGRMRAKDNGRVVQTRLNKNGWKLHIRAEENARERPIRVKKNRIAVQMGAKDRNKMLELKAIWTVMN